LKKVKRKPVLLKGDRAVKGTPKNLENLALEKTSHHSGGREASNSKPAEREKSSDPGCKKKKITTWKLGRV